MIDLSKYESTPLTEAYIVANTATYLLSEYRRDSGVTALASDHGVTELIDSLRQLIATRPRGVADAVRIYLCLIALTLKEPWADVREKLVEVDLSSVRWGPEIARITEARFTPSSVTHVSPSLAMPAKQGWITSTSSTCSVSIKSGD
jgi:hypothetical protein